MRRPQPPDSHTTLRDAARRPLWSDDAAHHQFASPSTDIDCDVLIVGAGFTGLWTAHHILEIDPRLHIVIIDAEQPGFGASGRNGGWVSALAPMDPDTLARQSGNDAPLLYLRALSRSVAEIGHFCRTQAPRATWAHAGTLTVATSEPQLRRLDQEIATARRHNIGREDLRHLSASECESMVHIRGTRGGIFSPHCGVINPRGLVDALVERLKGRGVEIYGGTRYLAHHVMSHGRHRPAGVSSPREVPITVTTSAPHNNTITTRRLILATEGFTPLIAGRRRDVAPLYSYMIATEPLPASVWKEIGWTERITVADARRMVIYAQRTGDDRIAFGGRGAPYPFASRVHPRHDLHLRIHSAILETMHSLFPATTPFAITHRWGGPLGAHRDWFTSVAHEDNQQVVTIHGYVGDGVAASHLAARCAAALVTDSDDEILSLPIVGHHSPRWEPEPLRYLAINSMLRVVDRADAHEFSTQAPSRLWGALADRLL